MGVILFILLIHVGLLHELHHVVREGKRAFSPYSIKRLRRYDHVTLRSRGWQCVRGLHKSHVVNLKAALFKQIGDRS